MLKLAASGVISVPQKPDSMPIGADHGRIAAELLDDQRQADPGGHHREGREGVAHDHREQRHAQAVGAHRGQPAAVRRIR
jgi:hypothetical protein